MLDIPQQLKDSPLCPSLGYNSGVPLDSHLEHEKLTHIAPPIDGAQHAGVTAIV